MPVYTVDVGQGRVITGPLVVTNKPCQLVGLFVTTSLGTSRIFIADAAASVASAASAVVVRKFVSSIAKTFMRVPIAMGNGLYVSLTGSAQVVTVVYQPAGGAPL